MLLVIFVSVINLFKSFNHELPQVVDIDLTPAKCCFVSHVGWENKTESFSINKLKQNYRCTQCFNHMLLKFHGAYHLSL